MKSHLRLRGRLLLGRGWYFAGLLVWGSINSVDGLAWGQVPAVPISANSPHVVLGLTTQRNPDDTDFFSVPGTPNNSALPVQGGAHYEIAILDTGAPVVILGNKAAAAFDIEGAGKGGTMLAPIVGVTDSYNSDPLGNFAAGLNAITGIGAGGDLAVDRSRLVGSYNDSIVYAGPGDQLPTLVGTTIAGRYTTTIDYGTPQIIEVDGRLVRSPAVEFHEVGSLERPSRRLGLTMVDGALGPSPAFLPNLDDFDFNDLGNNPATPTIGGSFFLTANVKNNGVERNQLQMFFDTGSQATIVSEQIAAEMGFDVSLDKPDFVVRIQGVVETFEDVPGFYADEFVLPGTGGGVTLKNVPLVVFNFPDPRSPSNTLPGIIGMNLFHDRNLILNPEPGAPYLGVSDPVLISHRWIATTSVGAWETPEHWNAAGPPGIQGRALLTNGAAGSQVAQIHADTTVASVEISGALDAASPTTMTVDIADNQTLHLFGNVILDGGGRIHVRDGALLDALAVEVRGGEVSGTGVVGGEVLSQGVVSPGGALNESSPIGLLQFTGSFDQLSRGQLALEIGATGENDRIEVVLDTLLDGSLRLQSLTSAATRTADSVEKLLLVTARHVFGEFDDASWNGLAMTRDGAWRFRGTDGRGLWGTTSRETSAEAEKIWLSVYRAIPGDADGNGEVSFQDFLILSSNFSHSANWLGGDFDGTGTVEFADFLLLSSNFGRQGQGGNGAGNAVVPEPMSVLPLLSCVLWFGRGQFRRSARPKRQCHQG